jgi:branched-chain amino acid transport system substrate-binding protein
MKRVLTGIIIIALAALAAASAATSTPGRSHVTGTLQIGMAASLEGDYAVFDVPEIAGMKYAEKKINAQGGLNGIKVHLNILDTKGQTALATTVAQQLLDQGVRTFVASTSLNAIAAGQLIMKRGGMTTMGYSTEPRVTWQVGPRAFLSAFGDNVQAAAMAEYACSKGYKTTYTVLSPSSPYTSAEGMGSYYKQAYARKCGGKIVGSSTYKIGDQEYTSQVTQIQSFKPKPDVIFTPMFVPDVATFLKQLRGAGVTIPVLGTDGDGDPTLTKAAGAAANGLTYSDHGVVDPKGDPALVNFLADFKKVMGKPADSPILDTIGRDNVYLLVAAAQKAGTLTDGVKIAQALQHISGVQLVQGTMSMNPKTRIPNLPVFVVTIKNGVPTWVKTVRPSWTAAP